MLRELEMLEQKRADQDAELAQLRIESAGLRKALAAALEWIDAVPKTIVLPSMPGFDRDWVDTTLASPASDWLADHDAKVRKATLTQAVSKIWQQLGTAPSWRLQKVADLLQRMEEDVNG